MKNKIVEFKDLKIPEKFIGNFEGFDDLELSNYEKEILRDLRQYSDTYGAEAIKVIFEGGETEIQSDYLYGKVKVPKDTIGKKHIIIYHSHTDISTFSISDICKLSNIDVDTIVLINRAYYVYVIKTTDSNRPSFFEIRNKYDDIKHEVAHDLLRGCYGTMNMDELNYMYIQECMYRICRYYKWLIQGGILDE